MVKARLDISGWRNKFDRVSIAIKQMPDVHVVPKGALNKEKVRVAEENGDELDITPAAMRDCQQLLVAGTAAIANNKQRNMTPTAKEMGKRLAEDCRDSIRDGRVIPGYDRSDATRARKGHDKALFDTGDLAESLTYKLIRR